MAATAANGARIINMSFTGPSDPVTLRSLQAAYSRGIVLIAAAGANRQVGLPTHPSPPQMSDFH